MAKLISLQVPPDVHARLARLAKTLGIGRAEVLRRALDALASHRTVDQREAVLLELLQDPANKAMSTRWYADRAGVSYTFAAKIRSRFLSKLGRRARKAAMPDRVVGRDGRLYPSSH